MTDAEFFRMTAELFPAPTATPHPAPGAQTVHRDREQTLTGLWADADTQANIRGTAWAGTRP